MLRITRLTDYATVILAHMASAPAQVCSAKSLSDNMKIGLPTVSKILKMLSARSIVLATRGAEGGYRLFQSPESVTLVDILAAMEGPVALTECAMAGHHCLQAHDCGVQGHWQRINEVVMTALRQVTLADLIQSPANSPFILRSSDILNALRRGAVS